MENAWKFLQIQRRPTKPFLKGPGVTKLNSVVLVRKRTIPTERPQPAGEVSANSAKVGPGVTSTKMKILLNSNYSKIHCIEYS
jgi:hypothetical protein